MSPKTYKEFKRFCNDLRCPLCGSQLDGNVHTTQAQLYCVMDNEEYIVQWTLNKEAPYYERVCHRYSQYEYIVVSGVSTTRISRISTDIHPFKRTWHHFELLVEYNGVISPYFKQRLTEQELLKKIKLYQVFS